MSVEADPSVVIREKAMKQLKVSGSAGRGCRIDSVCRKTCHAGDIFF